MEPIISPWIFYVIGCSVISFFTALFAIMTRNDIDKIIEYNMVFKQENLRIADLKKENDIKNKKAKNGLFVVLF